MTAIYRVSAKKQPHHSDPLHWSNFYPDKQRHHRSTMNKRQDLILYLANLHASACRSGMPLGMIHIPMRLMSLRDWVQDYRVVLDVFFDVHSLGYNLGDGNHEISILTPKAWQNSDKLKSASTAAGVLEYAPGIRPDSDVVSKVYIQQQNADRILEKLTKTSRLDLYAPVQWLLKQAEVDFHFRRAGKLQLRDTSIWPVNGVETWPSWLREELFGQGLDIDSAYTQFLVSHLRKAYADQPHLLELLYPDLLRSLSDKKNWRIELCRDVLGMEVNEENIGVVKRVCMSLANGSRISPSILTGCRAYSITADLVIQACDDVTPSNLIRIGQRLQTIANQYVSARKAVCIKFLRQNPSRKNQKGVFSSYFEWERVARYMMWEAVDRHGIMVHDGIDGVPQRYLDRIPMIMERLNLRLTT